ncbi:phospholipid carrier-dependent glycosyltransferase, partial [Pseudomonas aeruginosa]|nr:phospholipid carrier-dependent glycosyltransferase [Pseudomonas aeruginosa]
MRALRGWPLAWFLLALAFAIRLLSLGSYPLMDTTEARYGEVARKMAELGDWITPWYDVGVPFWGKPPLAFWLSAGGQLLLGANEFASRLPHWLLGVLVLWLVWDWQAREDRRQARIACVLLGSSALFFVASGAVMTDMALALALVLAMRGFWLGLHGAEGIRRREGWLMFLGLGLGLLAKGPLTLILAGLPIGLWTLLEWRWRALWRGLPWIRGSLLMLLVAAPWYLLAELKTPGFLEYFLLGEHWQRFVTAGWDGDRYGNAHAYPY